MIQTTLKDPMTLENYEELFPLISDIFTAKTMNQDKYRQIGW